MMQYYERMREIRIDSDETQAQIAEVLGITKQQYQLYESGKRKIPIDLFIKFCDYYETSADYILGLKKGLKWHR